MSVREYIGARYVPLFADPLEWDATRTYEPLTVVLYQGNSFTSRQAVPANIPITNTTYWAQTGNYNAQIEQYRAEVQTFDNRITANEQALGDGFSSTNTVTMQMANKANSTDVTTEISQAVSGLASETYVDNTVSGLASETYVNNAVSGLASETYVNNAVSTKANATELVKLQRNIRNRKIVVVGDSLSTTGAWSSTAWPSYLSSVFGCTVYNKAIAGTGFVNQVNAQKFLTQLQAAVSDSSIVNSEITDVIIIGGYNDYAYESQIYAAVDDCITYARNNFTNATIHVGACLKGIYPLDYAIGGATAAQARSKLISQIERAAKRNGACIIESPWTWLMGYAAANYDNIHVNSTGQRSIAAIIYSHLTGGSTRFKMEEYISAATESMFSEFDCIANTMGDLVTINFHLKFAQNVSVGTKLFNIPNWAYFTGDRGPIINPLYGDTGSNQGAIWLDGTQAKWMKNGAISETGLNFYGTVNYPLGL